jgi:hypothetical protein
MNPACRYAVEVIAQDFTAGTRKAFRIPRRFKTRTGADKAAERLCWVCKPDGVHATSEQSAAVVEVRS